MGIAKELFIEKVGHNYLTSQLKEIMYGILKTDHKDNKDWEEWFPDQTL